MYPLSLDSQSLKRQLHISVNSQLMFVKNGGSKATKPIYHHNCYQPSKIFFWHQKVAQNLTGVETLPVSNIHWLPLAQAAAPCFCELLAYFCEEWWIQRYKANPSITITLTHLPSSSLGTIPMVQNLYGVDTLLVSVIPRIPLTPATAPYFGEFLAYVCEEWRIQSYKANPSP